jgi:hypothetical protein
MSDTNMFQAADRYLMSKKKPQERHKHENKITSYAASISNFKCLLCLKNSKDASYPIYRCQNFPDPAAKLKEIKRLNLCSRCANEHHTSDCRFRFRSVCSKCNQYHFSYLCQENSEINANNKNYQSKSQNNRGNSYHNYNRNQVRNTSKGPPNTNKVSTSSSLVTIEESSLSAYIDNKSMLPTFTAYANGKEIRILKDSGSQSNLVTFEAAKKFNFKILKEKINLTVNGVNQKQNYVSQVVEIPLEIGSRSYTTEALCLPSLSITLDLPDLPEIVGAFVEKGYNLADKRLINGGRKINDIELILGTKSVKCLPEVDLEFGEQSVYAQTHIGTILKGDCEQMLRDVSYLPYATESQSASVNVPHLHPYVYKATTHIEAFDHAELEGLDEERIECKLSYEILDDNGEVVEEELLKATNDELENQCRKHTSLDMNEYKEDSSEINDALINFTFLNLKRDDTGRLIMPLFWDSQTAHLLGKNKFIAEKFYMLISEGLKEILLI